MDRLKTDATEVCVEIEFEGKVRRSKPMPWEDAITLWAITGDMSCRIVPAQGEGLLWPGTPDEAEELRREYEAEAARDD